MLALQSLTFELRIMARKKRMLLIQPKSGFKRILTFKINAQEAKMGQPLAPILGQVQINVAEFVNYFNNKTKDYPKGLPLKIKLLVKWDKSYHIEINKISLIRLINLFIFENPNIDYNQENENYNRVINNSKFRFLYILDFFKIVKLHSIQNKLKLLDSISIVYGQLHLSKIKLTNIDRSLFFDTLDSVVSFFELDIFCRQFFEI